ncbi:MAG TPA: hypothetical protein VGO56_15475 [Pyrinomonadaceae bacterium]|jgi:hypothetical protein|nr:hypothetical protein [Pyrinomonadaceae bacterium]
MKSERRIVQQELIAAISGRIDDATSKFLDTYGLAGAGLPSTAGAAAHDAKNIMMNVVHYLDHTLLKNNHARRITVENVKDLSDLRDALTLCQRVLTAERSDIRMRQFQKYLDILLPNTSGNLLKS